jgi:predicted ABC-type ATPase
VPRHATQDGQVGRRHVFGGGHAVAGDVLSERPTKNCEQIDQKVLEGRQKCD